MIGIWESESFLQSVLETRMNTAIHFFQVTRLCTHRAFRSATAPERPAHADVFCSDCPSGSLSNESVLEP